MSRGSRCADRGWPDRRASRRQLRAFSDRPERSIGQLGRLCRLHDRCVFAANHAWYWLGKGVVWRLGIDVQQGKPATVAAVDAAARAAAAAELDELAIACNGVTWRELRSAIADWHLDKLANARAGAWIPGMAGARDPLTENLLSRFYHYQVRTIVTRLNTEIADLRTRLSSVLQSIGFYASGGNDGGERANAILQRLAMLHRSSGRPEQALDGTDRNSFHDVVSHQDQGWQDRARLVIHR